MGIMVEALFMGNAGFIPYIAVLFIVQAPINPISPISPINPINPINPITL